MEMSCCEIDCMEITPLENGKLFREWLERMPEYRKRKVASLRSAESQRLSLGVGILLFHALEKRGIDGSAVRIGEGEYGQPWLPEWPEIHFSLSHAGKWALCAVSGLPVGCDAERSGRGNLRVAERFFHPEEKAALAKENDPEARDLLFTRIWTRKESYVKAIGKGVSFPLQSFSVLTPEKGVWFAEKDPEEGYAFSCCMLGPAPEETLWRTAYPD